MVIVVALFVVALVATMAYVMMERLERDVRRTQLILRDTQANFYLQGAVAWAQDQLKNDWENQVKDKLIDAIPIKSPENTENGYQISSVIYDMQSRYNLNNLTSPEDVAAFERLISAVIPAISQENAQGIATATAEWIKPGRNDGGVNQYYLNLPVPYRAAHRPMISESELRLVKGVTQEIYQALQAYVTALPANTLINVQTAEAPVLLSLSKSLKLDAVKAIVAARTKKAFLKKEDFLALDVVKNNQIKDAKFVTVSQYFLLETHISIENQNLVIYTLLERVAKEKKAEVNIVWQSRGVW